MYVCMYVFLYMLERLKIMGGDIGELGGRSPKVRGWGDPW